MDDVVDDLLRERVQRAFDADDDSDWHDVVRRARRRRPSPVRRPVFAVALMGLIAITFLIVPGPGLGYLRGLFGGEPAPPSIEEVMAGADQGAPENLAPGVEAEQTHKLIQIRTSDGRPTILWVAPSQSGGICTYVQRGRRLAGGPGCREQTLPETAPINWLLQGSTPSDRVVLLSGSVSDRIRQLVVSYDDGTTDSIELTQGFFLYEILPERLRTGHQPISLIGYDSSGAEVGRIALAGVGIYPSNG